VVSRPPHGRLKALQKRRCTTTRGRLATQAPRYVGRLLSLRAALQWRMPAITCKRIKDRPVTWRALSVFKPMCPKLSLPLIYAVGPIDKER
jgi:hypothetical protein